MHKGLHPPHLLLASSNPVKMLQNLAHILNAAELAKITDDLDKNARSLFHLGETHHNFALPLTDADWRQKISRLYYAVYNVRRAIQLKYNGSFSTDASDHNKLDLLPDTLANKDSHIVNLRNLREDRNLADYNHMAVIGDLVITPTEAENFSTTFIADSRSYLATRGLTV